MIIINVDYKIKIGICGYGNLGRAAETEIAKNPDMELAVIFSRRKPEELRRRASGVPVAGPENAAEWRGKLDALILCGGSSKDLPSQVVEYAKLFNTVDSYDAHAKIPGYFESADAAAKSGGNIAVVSAGWDPGLFSILRLYMGSMIPCGKTYTFWGKGVSQGHSFAVKTIAGVEDAIQYTLPNEDALGRVRRGETPELSARQRMKRLCYVAAADGADRARIENEIKTMPDYFADYDTEVVFISLDELHASHSRMTHGGNVIHSGATGSDNRHLIELSVKLDSNPEFTASILLAYARAAYRLSARGETGARTVFDIPPSLLSPMDRAQMLGLL